MKTSKSRALKGYQGRDPISHRTYNFKTATKRYKKTGNLIYRGKGAAKGSGHRAGEQWGEAKRIDPDSDETKYSKNSPSFDEGVYQYKQRAKNKALMKQVFTFKEREKETA